MWPRHNGPILAAANKREIKLAAAWMGKPVADTPNNWVPVETTANGKYLAAVGKEIFAVKITVNLPDGKILSGVLDNLAETVERACDDATLT
jgi:hypothetical protein